jgi:hypothetical protein
MSNDLSRATRLGCCLVVCFALAEPSQARVLRVEIERRVPILAGQPFGEAGAYELIEGQVHFGFDPQNAANARVSDIGLAPRGDDGLVHAWSELVVLQAVDPKKRSGTALVEVPNRGMRLALASQNRSKLTFGTPPGLDPGEPGDWGDGFMMEQGLTVIWVGWQVDAPDMPGGMRLRAPVAVNPDGSAVRGLARSDWVVEARSAELGLATPGHRAHVVADPKAPENVLTRRSTREGRRVVVPRSRWRFSHDGTRVLVDEPLDPAVYELVYVAEGPPLVGLGLAAFRDIATYAERDPGAVFPVARSVATGSSQSGRFLRHFLYEGFNRDESGKQVYEGVIINIAGGGRGGFNHRFSHPGRVGNPFQSFFYPGDDFPFTSRPVTGRGAESDTGLLDRAVQSRTLPKIFQINTGYEYWGRVASLVHMTPDGSEDVEPLANERLYHVASAPHFPMPFPPAPETEVEPGVYRGSSIDTSYLGRSLLLHMLRWVEQGTLPPASRVPRIDAGTLVTADSLDYPIRSLRKPRTPHVAYRQDFGPRFAEGIVEHQPPRRGRAFAVRLPALDALGSEETGVRLLELTVPIGTYTPWATRSGYAFAEQEMAGYVGSFIPLMANEEQQSLRGDERPTVSELYPSKAAYTARLDREIAKLMTDGWLLERDQARAREAALQRWEWIAARPGSMSK